MASKLRTYSWWQDRDFESRSSYLPFFFLVTYKKFDERANFVKKEKDVPDFSDSDIIIGCGPKSITVAK